MKNLLLAYITTKRVPGWRDEFERTALSVTRNADRLCGLYGSMLDELVELVGRDTVGTLVAADDSLRDLVERKCQAMSDVVGPQP